jgi:hypothetical protein
MGAYYVNAIDKEIWRNGLIDWLAQVDDLSLYPVMAVGAATWALASTGDLDDTLVDQYGTGAAYWSGRELDELPGILLGHQVPEDDPNEGSFYWRFDHSNGGFERDEAAGYTEDAVYGTLGLIASMPYMALRRNICDAQTFLLNSFGLDGIVYDHLKLQEYDFYTYAGEVLQALGPTVPLCGGDIAQTNSLPGPDGKVDIGDLQCLLNAMISYGVAPTFDITGLCCYVNGNMDIAQTNSLPGSDGNVDIGDLQLLLNTMIMHGSAPTYEVPGF